jgi:NADH-quinone oxidoreductase subunit N
MWTNELTKVSPEIWLVCMASIILVLDQFLAQRTKWVTYVLCQLTLVGALFLSFELLGEKTTLLFNNMYILDHMGTVLKMAILLIAFFVLIYSRKYIFQHPIYHGEYFVLCLFSIFGMMVLISTMHFLTLYLGVELIALPIYALITMIKDDKTAPEGAMKYFVMGALASGMLLYGISLLYGATGSLELATIAKQLSLQPKEAPQTALLFGLVFVLVSLAFKFGAVPFHMWLPDVYQAAAMPVTLFIGTLPKIAAFGFAIRLLVDTFAPFNPHWQQLIMIMAILSLVIGNIVAIAQTNLKRMLAYSTIAHIGFLFLGLLAGPQSGFAAAMDYIIVYALMALGAFGIMTAVSHCGFEAENIDDYRGFGKRSPWIAFLMMLLMLSLAGIPPFAGFYAKFFVLNALVQAGYTWLAVLAVLLTVIGAYYYLRVIKVMFFDKPTDSVHFYPVSRSGVAVLSINSLTLLALGIYPAPLFNLCLTVMNIQK